MDTPKPSLLIWDFYGRTARGTANHFARHLEDFLARHSMAAENTSLVSEHTGHCALQVTMNNGDDAAAVARTLKASPRSHLPSLNAP